MVSSLKSIAAAFLVFGTTFVSAATAPTTLGEPATHALHQAFPGLNLIDRNHKPQSLKQGETVLLYFSAHWCPPCRGFTPMLTAFTSPVAPLPEVAADPSRREAIVAANFPRGAVRVVFVSSDREQEGFNGYFASMGDDWLAVRWTDQAMRQSLGQTYGANGIPHLVAISNLPGAAEIAGGPQLKNEIFGGVRLIFSNVWRTLFVPDPVSVGVNGSIV